MPVHRSLCTLPLLLQRRHHPQAPEIPQGRPHSVQTSGSMLTPRPTSPGPGCENWGSHSLASRPPLRATRGSRIWHWWASSRSQPPGPAGHPPAEARGGLHLPARPSSRGPRPRSRPIPRPPAYLLCAHLLWHHNDAAIALHGGGQGQPNPWGQDMG